MSQPAQPSQPMQTYAPVRFLRTYDELEAEVDAARAGEAVMREALEQTLALMERKARMDSDDISHVQRVTKALDGTAASALLAELRQLRERVKQLEGST